MMVRNMAILDQLSSQVGDRSEAANRQVALQCLDDPGLLIEIAAGLRGKDAALVGDCAEVFTMVAEQQPAWVAPYAEGLAALLNHKATRVRWEAMHALALVAAYVPTLMASLLATLGEKIVSDTSVIVRDHAVDAVANYAATSEAAARSAYPILKEALTAWDGKQAGHALKGLIHVAQKVPALQDELYGIGEAYFHSQKGVVRKAASEIVRGRL